MESPPDLFFFGSVVVVLVDSSLPGVRKEEVIRRIYDLHDALQCVLHRAVICSHVIFSNAIISPFRPKLPLPPTGPSAEPVEVSTKNILATSNCRDKPQTCSKVYVNNTRQAELTTELTIEKSGIESSKTNHS